MNEADACGWAVSEAGAFGWAVNEGCSTTLEEIVILSANEQAPVVITACDSP